MNFLLRPTSLMRTAPRLWVALTLSPMVPSVLHVLSAETGAPGNRGEPLDDLPSYRPEVQLEGATLRVFGGDLRGQIPVWEKGFKSFHSEMAGFENNFAATSGGALAGLYTGISDVGPAGDEAKISDITPFHNRFGYLPIEVTVTTGSADKKDALWAPVFFVHQDNPLAGLTMKQVDGIFGAERDGTWEGLPGHADGIWPVWSSAHARGAEENIRTWGQLGLTGEWSEKKIHVYGYALGYGSFGANFDHVALHWANKMNPEYREYMEARSIPADVRGGALTTEAALGQMSQDPSAIGWGWLEQVRKFPNLKPLGLAARAGDPWVALTTASVRDRSYPMVRGGVIYLNRKPGTPLDPKVREFLRYILSREGQQDVIDVGINLPLTADFLRGQRAKLD